MDEIGERLEFVRFAALLVVAFVAPPPEPGWQAVVTFAGWLVVVGTSLALLLRSRKGVGG